VLKVALNNIDGIGDIIPKKRKASFQVFKPEQEHITLKQLQYIRATDVCHQENYFELFFRSEAVHRTQL
jgi:hypothetical protein